MTVTRARPPYQLQAVILLHLSRAFLLYASRMWLLRFACLLCFALRASLFDYIISLRCLIAINCYIAVIAVCDVDIDIVYFLYSLYLFLYCVTFVTSIHLYHLFFAVARVASLHVPTHPPTQARVGARARSWLAVRALSLRFAPLPLRSQHRQRSRATARIEYLKNW